MRGLLHQIEDTKNDLLLRIGWLYKLPINELFTQYCTALDEYINNRLKAVTSNEAKQLARKTAARLTRFKNQVDVFARFISDWRGQLEQNYRAVIKPQALNGYVIMQNQIAALADQLIQDTDFTYADFMAEMNAAFAEWLAQADTTQPPRGADNKRIEDRVRARFLSGLASRNVIDEFMREQEIKAHAPGAGTADASNIGRSTVSQVAAKAELFVSMTIKDTLALVEPERTEQEWFFYPDGDASDNGASGNHFTQILKSLAMVKNWGEQCHDSSDAYTIMFLREKGCFPLRYLDLLTDPQMSVALNSTRNIQLINEGKVPNTYLSRLDVDFLPLEQIDAERLENIKISLIVSIVTGTLRPEENFFVYRSDSGRHNYYDTSRRTLRLPRQYKAAVYKLNDAGDLLGSLKAANDKFILNNRPEFLIRLHEFLPNPLPYGLILGNAEADKEDMRHLMVDEFIKPNPELFEAWNNAFPNEPIEHASENFEYIYPNMTDETHPHPGFYCINCHQYMGNPVIEGTPDFGKIAEFKREHTCNR
jgi:hypothetical protein